jgi:hypothetical protein
MHVTPANRQAVYRVVVGHWTDRGTGIGVETVATRAKLSEEATRSVLDVLDEAGLLARVDRDADHPTWIPTATASTVVGRGTPFRRAG